MSRPLMYNRLTVKATGRDFGGLLHLFTGSDGKDPTPFNQLIPMPDAIWKTEATTYDEEYSDLWNEGVIFDKNQDGKERQMYPAERDQYLTESPAKKRLFNQYGVKNWRQWSLKNWGSTWEAKDIIIEALKDEIVIRFTTYFEVPWQIYVAISENFPHLTFAADCYSYDLNKSCAIGYAPNFPLRKEDHCPGLANENRQIVILLSNNFIRFGQRFNQFPIHGHIATWYDPKSMNAEPVKEEIKLEDDFPF